MNMINKKKAVFFSIASILIIVLFMTMTRLSSDISMKETEIEITRARIKVLNSVIKDMEDTYFERMIYVAGKNSLIGLSRYYSNNYANIRKRLFYAMEDTINNGTLMKPNNQVDIDLLANNYMNPDYTSDALTEQIKNLFEHIGFEVVELKIDISKEKFWQDDPWHIIVEADVIYDLRDKNGIVSWKGTATKQAKISVIGLHAYDYEKRTLSNRGIITENWVVDEGPYYTEYSLITKLGSYRSSLLPQGVTASSEHGLGLCSPGFKVGPINDKTCADDVQGDHS